MVAAVKEEGVSGTNHLLKIPLIILLLIVGPQGDLDHVVDHPPPLGPRWR